MYMTKLQLTLTDEEVRLLTRKAAFLGYDVTKYVKFVLAREAEDVLKNTQVFKASQIMEKLIDEAISDEENGLVNEWPLTKYGD